MRSLFFSLVVTVASFGLMAAAPSQARADWDDYPAYSYPYYNYYAYPTYYPTYYPSYYGYPYTGYSYYPNYYSYYYSW